LQAATLAKNYVIRERFAFQVCFQKLLCLNFLNTLSLDGLFGQCYNDAESELVKPLVLEQPLDEFQSELLRTELTRLANNGLDWPHARSQCILAYFKLSVVYQLDYDTEFCSVRNPNNIWSLVQVDFYLCNFFGFILTTIVFSVFKTR
jgi:hypothetical protein